MQPTIEEQKREMCEIGRRIWMKGFCAGNEGNHSLRLSEDRYLCTPTGISKGFLEPADICVVDGEGKQVERNTKGRKRTSEILVHLAIYQKRPDVKAVIHSHPPHATAFAIAGIPLPEGIHPEAEVFLGKVRTAPYALPSTQALPDSILPLVGPQTNTVLMGNHGSVSFAATLIDTYYRLEILDAYCRILLLTRQLGHANVLDQQQMVDLLKVKEKFGLADDRMTCAPEGCVGQDNQAFIASFGVTPASAVCAAGSGGAVQSHDCGCGGNSQGACQCEGTSPTRGAASGLDGEQFEQMVQLLTDQIMAGMTG